MILRVKITYFPKRYQLTDLCNGWLCFVFEIKCEFLSTLNKKFGFKALRNTLEHQKHHGICGSCYILIDNIGVP
jgi:hypothetical protein